MLFKKKNVFSLLRASIESEWKFLLHIDYMCKAHAWRRFVLFIFIIWVLLRARLNNHYEARSCKEKKKESRLENQTWDQLELHGKAVPVWGPLVPIDPRTCPILTHFCPHKYYTWNYVEKNICNTKWRDSKAY